jgi:hypothetical protein
MKNTKKLIDSLQSLKSSSFISINNYLSKTGEIANHTININISVKNAKQTDLNRLKQCNETDLKQIAFNSNLSTEICKIALSELIIAAEKNLNTDIDERTNQSKAQTDAYINITPAIKLHKDTLALHIFGQTINKKVLATGTYKEVNCNNKTKAKQAIKKHLDLRSDKFRNYIIENANNFKINGEVIEII